MGENAIIAKIESTYWRNVSISISKVVIVSFTVTNHMISASRWTV